MSSLKLKLKDLEYWLLIFGLYTDVLIEPVFMFMVIVLIFQRGGQIAIKKNLVLGFAVLFLWSSIAIVIVGHSPNKFIQQLVLLLYFFSTYHIIFRNNENNIEDIFQIYLKLTYFLCVTALIQFVVYFLTNVNIFPTFNVNADGITAYVTPRILRVTSICAEPSNFSRLITPALGYYLFNDKQKGQDSKKLIIGIAFILTFSTMSYLIAFAMVAYKYIILKKYLFIRITSIIIAIFCSVLLFKAINNSEDAKTNDKGVLSDINMKIRDITTGLKDLDPHALELLNLSSYATLANVWVAKNADSRVIGTGLGTHQQNYESKYQSNYKYYGLNKAEGYALGTRIYSEYGLIGIILLCLFLCKFHNKNNLINISVLFLILTVIFRGGHYTRYGSIFFFFMYYYTSKFALNNRTEK